MPDDLTTVLLLVGAGLVAGTVNSIAGGGSLLTLPLLIFIGLPPTVANATNRIAIFFGSVGATHSFVRHGLVPYDWLKLTLPTALVGVGLGTWAASVVGDVAFERILAGLLVASAAWLVWKPLKTSGGEHDVPEPEGRTRRLVLLASFGLGLYSGFIQAGFGFIFLAIFSALGFNLVRANALKVTMILVFTTVSIALFWIAGLLDWGAGFTMAVGQFAGAKLGVHLQVLKGQAWVRNVLVIAIVGFALRLLFGG